MKRILITSALPYINGIKHLGNLVGSMLPADLYARFQRQCGHEVLYICATDEHGTPAELAAAAAQQAPDQYCAAMHQTHQQLGEAFALSFNVFGRSSAPQNHALTQHFARVLWQNGYIEARATQQMYSHTDGRFLPDRYVEGTCPHCGYTKARGDQCESCTRVLDPADLLQPRSAISGATDLELRDSTHLFLLQSKLVPQLRAFIEQQKQQKWPYQVTAIAEKWLNEGLEDRCITRDLVWGVPVPADMVQAIEGIAGKVFYVWFDAPIAYIAATQQLFDAQNDPNGWQRWWRTDAGADNVHYVQFMAKDNVPFHTISFPATLIGSGAAWKQPDYLKGFNWLTYYGGKFSTSQQRGIFMDAALALYPADYWRWFLLSNAPETSDSAFTWEGLQTAVNKDLADVLGNFVNRTVSFAHARLGGVVPAIDTLSEIETALYAELQQRLTDYTAAMEALEIRKAAAELRAMWAAGNVYLQTAAPWTRIKTDPAAAGTAVRVALELAVLFAQLAAPFVPTLAGNILALLGVAPATQWPTTVDALQLTTDTPLQVAQQVLVTKIDDDAVAAHKAQYGE